MGNGEVIRAGDVQLMSAVPTPDHYWPLVYALGAAHKDGPPSMLYERFQNGTISMRCIKFG